MTIWLLVDAAVLKFVASGAPKTVDFSKSVASSLVIGPNASRRPLEMPGNAEITL